ncbi:hypothetical protein AGOR_G00093700 [Albula goreensis]|uniref:Uncharacterized protein n=1 Tax=Albula goreensis TaxID=1534307 RepID=A0A8T3DHJ2_9TELE|nr:hypothetical protein AGOR_G00093700 [Albula goreensis]
MDGGHEGKNVGSIAEAEIEEDDEEEEKENTEQFAFVGETEDKVLSTGENGAGHEKWDQKEVITVSNAREIHDDLDMEVARDAEGEWKEEEEGENTEVKESEQICEIEAKVQDTGENKGGIEVRPEDVITVCTDREIHDAAGDAEKGEWKGEEEGMKESEMVSEEDEEPIEVHSEKCEDRETEEKTSTETESKEVRCLNAEEENESIHRGEEFNRYEKQTEVPNIFGINIKGGQTEDTHGDTERENITKETDADKYIDQKDMWPLRHVAMKVEKEGMLEREMDTTEEELNDMQWEKYEDRETEEKISTEIESRESEHLSIGKENEGISESINEKELGDTEAIGTNNKYGQNEEIDVERDHTKEERTISNDKEVNDDLGVEVFGGAEEREMKEGDQGMKQKETGHEGEESIEIQWEKCDKETVENKTTGSENKETEYINVDKENEEKRDSMHIWEVVNKHEKQMEEPTIGINTKDGFKEDMDKDVEGDNITKETVKDKYIGQKDMGQLNTDKDEAITGMRRNEDNITVTTEQHKEKESGECIEEDKMEHIKVNIVGDEKGINNSGGGTKNENAVTEREELEEIWQEVVVIEEKEDEEEKDAKIQVREAYKEKAEGKLGLGEGGEIITEEWKEGIKGEKEGVASDTTQLKVILDGDGKDDAEKQGQDEQFNELTTEGRQDSVKNAGEELTEMDKENNVRDFSPRVVIETEEVYAEGGDNRGKEGGEEGRILEGTEGENTEVKESEQICEIEAKVQDTGENKGGIEVRPEDVITVCTDREIHGAAGDVEKGEWKGEEEGMKESEMVSEEDEEPIEVHSDKCEDRETEEETSTETDSKEVRCLNAEEENESIHRGEELGGLRVKEENEKMQKSMNIEVEISVEIGGTKPIERNKKDDPNEEINVEAGGVTLDKVEEKDNEHQNQPYMPLLDFTPQKCRIALKNPHSRPPKNPRTLLQIPSLLPTSSTSPQSGPPNKAPVALKQGDPRVIGFKLPGMGGEFPALKKTPRGTRESDEGVKSQNSAQQKSSDSPQANKLRCDREEGAVDKAVGGGVIGVKLPGFGAGFPGLRKTDRGMKMREQTPEEDTSSCSDRAEKTDMTGSGGLKGIGVTAVKIPGFGPGFPVLRKTDRGVKMREEDTQSHTQDSELKQDIKDVCQKEMPLKAKSTWTPPGGAGTGIGGQPMMSELKNKLKKTEKE